MNTSTFFTFVGDQCGKGTEALDFYTSVFPNSSIGKLNHYKECESGGTPELIKYGEFTLNGVIYGISESNYNHQWSFSPAISILITDKDEALIQQLFDELSTDGQIMVPLDSYNGEGDYGFGKKFGWCADKFGVNWQFILK